MRFRWLLISFNQRGFESVKVKLVPCDLFRIFRYIVDLQTRSYFVNIIKRKKSFAPNLMISAILWWIPSLRKQSFLILIMSLTYFCWINIIGISIFQAASSAGFWDLRRILVICTGWKAPPLKVLLPESSITPQIPQGFAFLASSPLLLLILPDPLQWLAELPSALWSCEVTLPKDVADPPNLNTAKDQGDKTQLDVSPVQLIHYACCALWHRFVSWWCLNVHWLPWRPFRSAHRSL